MTRREVERLAEAVKQAAREEKGEPLTAARMGVLIGRACLFPSDVVWSKWFEACGWPKEITKEMGAIEAGRVGR